MRRLAATQPGSQNRGYVGATLLRRGRLGEWVAVLSMRKSTPRHLRSQRYRGKPSGTGTMADLDAGRQRPPLRATPSGDAAGRPQNGTGLDPIAILNYHPVPVDQLGYRCALRRRAPAMNCARRRIALRRIAVAPAGRPAPQGCGRMRVEIAKVFCHPVMREFCDTPATPPVGPAPQIRNVSSFRCSAGSSVASAFLKRCSRMRLRNRVVSETHFQPRRVDCPFLLKYPRRRTGRQHERVVCNRPTIGDHSARSGVHCGGAAQHPHSSIRERGAHRRGDIGWRKGSCCDLTQTTVGNRPTSLPVYQRGRGAGSWRSPAAHAMPPVQTCAETRHVARRDVSRPRRRALQ